MHFYLKLIRLFLYLRLFVITSRTKRRSRYIFSTSLFVGYIFFCIYSSLPFFRWATMFKRLQFILKQHLFQMLHIKCAICQKLIFYINIFKCLFLLLLEFILKSTAVTFLQKFEKQVRHFNTLDILQTHGKKRRR